MKRLITILLSFIGYVSLFGQGVPMVVAGKVHINGPVRSQGAVHVYAAKTGVDTGKIMINSTTATALLATDTVILYSNDTSDGLLANLNATTTAGVKGITASDNPAKVIVRKTFAQGKYTYFSLPFDVAPADIKKGNTATALPNGGNDWGIWGFDAKKRSEHENYTNNVWKEITYSSDNLVAAAGYQFYHVAGGDVDFVTTTANDIKHLFENTGATHEKHVNFLIHMDKDGPQGSLDAGWAFIGGRNASTFKISKDNIQNYTGTVYFRNSNTSQATGTQQHDRYGERVLSANETLNLAPYTPFYIQNTITAVGNTSKVFTYKSGGLFLESAEFRSASEEAGSIKDQLYFALSSDKDASFDRFYLNFTDGYTESYRGVEDAIKMSTSYDASPAVWSLLDGMNQELVVNGLPMKDERSVNIGFSVPESGDYTISLNPMHQTDVRNVVLVDNLTGQKVDLLQGSYSFSTEAIKKNNNRFVVFINSSYTGTPTINGEAVYAYVKDNLLTVRNLSEGDRVQILDLAGRTIASGRASGKEFSTVLSQKGVYVVNVSGKASVLKVLNK
jgi:hypothetical protein